MRRRRLSIFQMIIVTFLVSVLPLYAFSLLLIGMAYNNNHESILQTTREECRATAQGIDRSIQAMYVRQFEMLHEDSVLLPTFPNYSANSTYQRVAAIRQLQSGVKNVASLNDYVESISLYYPEHGMMITTNQQSQYRQMNETDFVWLQMLDTIWALVLPGAVPVFNVLVMINFYRSIPVEMEEAAIIDGAGQWRILWQIFLPTSLPAIATITVFSLVGHWNNWFDGLILMNHPENYPMSSYLRVLLFQSTILEASTSSSRELMEISERTLQCAQMFLGLLPIMLVYPFLQKYFVKGIMVGSVKG